MTDGLNTKIKVCFSTQPVQLSNLVYLLVRKKSLVNFVRMEKTVTEMLTGCFGTGQKCSYLHANN